MIDAQDTWYNRSFMRNFENIHNQKEVLNIKPDSGLRNAVLKARLQYLIEKHENQRQGAE